MKSHAIEDSDNLKKRFPMLLDSADSNIPAQTVELPATQGLNKVGRHGKVKAFPFR